MFIGISRRRRGFGAGIAGFEESQLMGANYRGYGVYVFCFKAISNVLFMSLGVQREEPRVRGLSERKVGECLTERALNENKNRGEIDVHPTTDRFPESQI